MPRFVFDKRGMAILQISSKAKKAGSRGGCWSMMGWWRKCFRERAHSERREATDGEKRPREADSSDTPERGGRRWGVKPCVH